MKEGTEKNRLRGRLFAMILVVFSATFIFFAAPVEAAKSCNAKPIDRGGAPFLIAGCPSVTIGGETLSCYHSLTGIVFSLLQAYKLLLGMVGSLALLMFVWGGFQWLISGGSEKRITAGMATLKNAVIGLLIVFGAWIGVNLIVATLNPSTNGRVQLAFKNSDDQWFTMHKGDLCYRALTAQELATALATPVAAANPCVIDETIKKSLVDTGFVSTNKATLVKNADSICSDSDGDHKVTEGKDFRIKNYLCTTDNYFLECFGGGSCTSKGFPNEYSKPSGKACQEVCDDEGKKLSTDNVTEKYEDKVLTCCCKFFKTDVGTTCDDTQPGQGCGPTLYCENKKCAKKKADGDPCPSTERKECLADKCTVWSDNTSRCGDDPSLQVKGVCCWNEELGDGEFEGQILNDVTQARCAKPYELGTGDRNVKKINARRFCFAPAAMASHTVTPNCGETIGGSTKYRNAWVKNKICPGATEGVDLPDQTFP